MVWLRERMLRERMLRERMLRERMLLFALGLGLGG